MNRLRDSKAFKYVACTILIVMVLQFGEYFLRREGLELRTAAQMIKGILIWLAAPFMTMFGMYFVLFAAEKKHPSWLQALYLVFFSLLILVAAFCRGIYYIFSDEWLTEKKMEDGFIEGSCSEIPSGTYIVYYEPVFGIFRRPFQGWSDTEATEKLQAKYGNDVTLVSSTYGDVLTYTADSSRPGTASFTFQADRSYPISDNFAYQLMKSDAVRFWENQNRIVTFLATENTGADDFVTYSFDSDRADTSKYPDAKDRLELWCNSEADIPNCAALITDWLIYALEDERYYRNDNIPGQNHGEPINYIWIRMGEDRYLISMYDIILHMDKDSWADTVEKLTQRIRGTLGISTFTEDSSTEDTEDNPLEKEDRLFMEFYQGDYEKEVLVGDGTIRFRMVVRDAALGQRFYCLLKSTDDGVTWEMENGDPFDEETGMDIDFTFLDETFGFSALTHHGGDDAVLYVTEDGGHNYQQCLFEGINVTLDNGYLYNPYDYPEMPYVENDVLYVLCGQGTDGDYNGGDNAGKALFVSTDHGHIFTFQEIVTPQF